VRILFHCADRVGAEMAGPGIRAVELARRLSRAHAVVLCAPGAASLSDPAFKTMEYEPQTLASRALEADALVTQGFGFPLSILRRLRGRLVLDLYDPVQLEQLAQFGARATADERVSLLYVRARLHLLLRRADHILCASAPQRTMWLGWLGAAGRLTPEALADDPEANALLAVVPFGVSEEPPVAGDHPLRRAVGVAPGTPLALWSGGMWDWMDPALAVHAMARIRDGGSPAHLVLLAGVRPGGDPGRSAAEAARSAARALRLDDRVHFLDKWIPYAERGAILLDADAAVSAHRPSLEAQLAFRTRLLDCLWARLPAAVTRGDVLAAAAEAEGWGAAADPGDADGLARALGSLLDPATNARARAAAAQAAASRTWDRAASTLLAILEGKAPPRPRGPVPGELAAEGPFGAAHALARKAIRRVLRRRARSGAPPA
jgi:glycosyltransferase involved in cell wall biosynthesis